MNILSYVNADVIIFYRELVKQISIAVFEWAHHIPQLPNPDTSQLWMAICFLQGWEKQTRDWLIGVVASAFIFPTASIPPEHTLPVSRLSVLADLFKFSFCFPTSFSSLFVKPDC